MIRKVLLVISIILLVIAGYLVVNDGVEIEVEKTGLIIDEVKNTGEGLEEHVPDFTQQKGYS